MAPGATEQPADADIGEITVPAGRPGTVPSGESERTGWLPITESSCNLS